MTIELREDQPAGFRTRREVVLSEHDGVEQAWSALLERQRLFHAQLRANGEGAGRATVNHLIVEVASGTVVLAASYTPGAGLKHPYAATIAPPWSTFD